MAVKRKYRLNLRNYGNLPAIMLSQYDEGYALEFEIRDGTDAASDLSAYTVTLKGTRADTLAYSFAGTVSTNVLTFVIDTTMTACAGRGTAEIAIKDTANDVLFATFNMPVFVERAAVPEGSIDADVERAQEIAEQVQEIVDNAAAAVSGEAEKWATGQINGTDVPSTDPAYENNAKYYAEQAETAAESIGIDATLTQTGKAADAKKTGDEITALKEKLWEEIEFVYGKAINIGSTIGAVINPTPVTTAHYKCAAMGCKAGDRFIINGTGGYSPKLWAFLDGNNAVLSFSDNEATNLDAPIFAPQNAAKIIINIATGYGNYPSYVGNYPYMYSVDQLTALRDGESSAPYTSADVAVKTKIEKLASSNGLEPISWVRDKWINIRGNIGDTAYTTPYSSVGKSYFDITCAEGDVFLINGSGGYTPSLWTFLDSNGKIVRQSTPEVSLINSYLIAPIGATRLIVNTQSNGTCYKVDKNFISEFFVEDVNSFYDGNINTNVVVGNTVNLSVENVSGWKHLIIPCSPNERIYIKGSGGGNPKLYAFLDSDNKLLLNGGTSYVENELVLISPQNSTILIVNFSTSYSHKLSYSSKDILKFGFNADEYFAKHVEFEELERPTPQDTLGQIIGGKKLADSLSNQIADFKKNGDKMVHVSTFCIINDVAYMTYYANITTTEEDPAYQIARLAKCPLNNVSNMTYYDLQAAGDAYDGNTVEGVYDTILMHKDDSTIYLMWTALINGYYYRLYRTYDVATGMLGSITKNSFKVGTTVNDFYYLGMKDALDQNFITYRSFWEDSDIGIMQKLSTRVENGTTYYYTGCYCGKFNCIIKSSDLITWEYVSEPPYETDSCWENSVYVLGDIVYYFVRQFAYRSYGLLMTYNITTDTWSIPVKVDDCQSRSDFLYYNNELYLIHAPKSRSHIAIMKINRTALSKSRNIMDAYVNDFFYPFALEYNGELYMSFTQTRQHIWLSKFYLYQEDEGVIQTKIASLFN